MQTNTQPTNQSANFGGGRIASDAYRATLAMASDFTGLEEGVDHYRLLLLVKKTAKLAGFTPRMVQLLDYYFAFTRPADWEEGARPIVYQSLSKTSLDLGVTERQIQKLEAALFEAGAITWNDSGNHRRYGQRCGKTGRLLWAFGVELTPLAFLMPQLEAKLDEKRLHDEAWLGTKRDISSQRRQIRALLAEWNQAEEGASVLIERFAARYDEIAIQLRTHLPLERMRSLLAEHATLHAELLKAMGVGEPASPQPVQKTPKGSPGSGPRFAHYKSTTHQSSEESSRNDQGLQESVAEPTEPEDQIHRSGLAHVTLGMAIGIASQRIKQSLPSDPDWRDLVEAVYANRRELDVSQASWGEACGVLGRTGAAICLLITDRATLRQDNPVRCPAAYFNGMIRRAREGELRLHNSVFGLLRTEDALSSCHPLAKRAKVES